jgi:hypothetical protein
VHFWNRVRGSQELAHVHRRQTTSCVALHATMAVSPSGQVHCTGRVLVVGWGVLVVGWGVLVVGSAVLVVGSSVLVVGSAVVVIGSILPVT